MELRALLLSWPLGLGHEMRVADYIASAQEAARHTLQIPTYASCVPLVDAPRPDVPRAPYWVPAFVAALGQIGLELHPRLEAACARSS